MPHAANDEENHVGGVENHGEEKHGEEKHGGQTSQPGSPKTTTDEVSYRGPASA